MRKTLALLAAFVALTTASVAKAEVFVWIDPVYKIKVAFPDNWMRQAQTDDDMRLWVLGPQGADHAACRLYSSNDGRFMDAPPESSLQVSNLVFSEEAVRQEMTKRFDVSNVRVSNFMPTATLGKGAATLSYVDFQKSWAGGVYDMRALVLGSQYHGTKILMSCEALAGSWPIWEPTMKAIMKSVDFPSAFTLWPNGAYRPFQNDGWVYLPVNKRSDAIGGY